MSGAQRIDEIIELLQAFVLSGANLSKRQVRAALRLLDWRSATRGRLMMAPRC
jgi:hypothetical protein